MRSLIAALSVCALTLCGCTAERTPDDQQSPGPETKAESTPAKAPEPAKDAAAPKPSSQPLGGYLDTVVKQPRRVEQKFNLMGLKQSLEAYRAINGEYPKTLDDLKTEGMPAPALPAGKAYKYDPKTGSVQVVDK